MNPAGIHTCIIFPLLPVGQNLPEHGLLVEDEQSQEVGDQRDEDERRREDEESEGDDREVGRGRRRLS